jgi:DNA (cytosine-5)-methyltransferase 1
MTRPRLLDLFSGAGGCSVGYHRAGFDVTGVDIRPMPRYPFTFVQGDALAYLREHGHEFDAIHASPPCQAYANVTRWRGDQSAHPDMIEDVRALLTQIGKTWVIENVMESPTSGVMLCGTMFGMRIRRHRRFESSILLMRPQRDCQHSSHDRPFMHKQERAYADAMGCGWMNNREGRQAIPPAYTEFVGRQLLAYLEGEQ